MFAQSNYISCIKINGNPILPPLITEDCRKNLAELKQKAIETEIRLKIRRSLQQNQTIRTSLEYKLSFGNGEYAKESSNLIDIDEDSQSDVNGSGDADNCALDSVPCNIIAKNNHFPNKLPNLSLNIIDVSQYSDEGIILFDPLEEYSAQSHATSEPNSTFNGHDGRSSDAEEDTVKLQSPPEHAQTISQAEEVTPREKPKPQLIRSNSYTLESPSPVLLQHFQRQAELHDESQLCDYKRRLSNIENQLHNISFSKDTHSSCKSISKSESSVLRNSTIGGTTWDLKNPSESRIEQPSNGCENPITAIQLDNEALPIQDNEMLEVLNLLREYDKQCFTIDSTDQHLDVSNHVVASSCEAEHILANVDTFTVATLEFATVSSPLTEDRSFVDCSSQTVYSVCSSETIDDCLPSPDNCSYAPDCLTETSVSARSSEWSHSKADDRAQREHRRKWAAIVLTAAVKGFLVRRLKRTEKVQILIQTIKDALMCAVSLHTEQNDAIQSADVELHRRLIQQVSAACYAFHDVFFKLSTKEQMAIIAMDRQKQQEKLNKLRTTNSKSRLSNTSLSTPKESKARFKRRYEQSIVL